jgi:phage/plasmid-like protein (TIGR03299 family)
MRIVQSGDCNSFGITANRFRERGTKLSAETTTWLRNNIVVGFTEKRGNAWWNSRGANGTDDQGRSNHFEGPVPVEIVRERLFNWQGERLPIYAGIPASMDENGVTAPQFVEIPGRVAIARSDNGLVMGIFKDGYVIHQYSEWLMDSIATILDDDLQIGSAGLLRGGAVGWVSVEVPENIVTPEGVEFRPNLFGVTSMDGTMATMFKRAVTHIVCDNTLNCARNEAGQEIKVKHSKYSGFRIGDARDALAVVHSAADDFAAEVAALSAIKVPARTFGKFLDAFSPMPDENGSKRALTMAESRREKLTEMWKSDPMVTPWKGTGFGIVQLVNTFDQHHTSVKRGEMSDNDKAAIRFERSVLGSVNGDLDKRTAEVIGILESVTA